MELMNNDEGVSPVVGVILMVAITVILSAIIATFVLDLGGTVSQNPQAGVSFDQSGDSASGDAQVNVQVVSMENADSVAIQHPNKPAENYTASMDSVGSSVVVGDSSQQGDESASGTFEDPGLSSDDKITVTATLEGKQQVIQTYTVK